MSHFCLEFVELYERLVGHFFFFFKFMYKGVVFAGSTSKMSLTMTYDSTGRL
jgi:hypothetical protein